MIVFDTLGKNVTPREIRGFVIRSTELFCITSSQVHQWCGFNCLLVVVLVDGLVVGVLASSTFTERDICGLSYGQENLFLPVGTWATRETEVYAQPLLVPTPTQSSCIGPWGEGCSRSRWEPHFGLYVLRTYEGFYWSWELVVFLNLLYVGGTCARLVYTWYKNIFRMIAVLIVFLLWAKKSNMTKTISKRDSSETETRQCYC